MLLLNANVIENLHTDVLTGVWPRDVFPMYQYVKLKADEMLKLYNSILASQLSEDDYLYDVSKSADCTCIIN